MNEQMAQYLGKPASVLLSAAPFYFWGFERTLDDEFTEVASISYVFPEHGLSLSCDLDESINTIFLEVDDFDQSLLALPISSTRREVIDFFGVPEKSGSPHTHAILGRYGAWDRFARAGYSIHVEYRVDADTIKMVTLMRADVVP